MGNWINVVVGWIGDIFFRRDEHPQVPPSPALDLKITFVSNQTPGPDEAVTIRWDYGNSDRLQSQCWQLHRVTFDGLVVSETHGCLPTGLLPAGQRADPCLPLSLRNADFRFISPVIFDLIAVDDEGTVFEQMVRLSPADFAFTANAEVVTAGYPRFVPQSTDIRFERAFGIIESPDHDGREDGVVGHIENSPYLSIRFPAVTPYLLTSNRGDLQEVGIRFEANRFGALLGRSFPPLKSTFLGGAGSEFVYGSRTRANIVIVGLTIAIDGAIDTVPTSNGKLATVITPSVRSLEPIFVQVDLRTSDTDKPTLVSDIHVGNLSQGLVLCVHRANNDNVVNMGVFVGTTDLQPITGDSAAEERRSTGSIEGARAGLRIQRVDSQACQAVYGNLSIDWTDVPLFPDNDLSGLMATQFRVS